MALLSESTFRKGRGHMSTKTRWTHAFATAIGIAAACSTDRLPTAESTIGGALQNRTEFDYREEAPFREIAQRIPSIGGWYFDTATGNLVVSLKDLRDAGSAKAALHSLLDHQPSGGGIDPQVDVIVRQAHYTWLQLKDWRDLLRAVMPATPAMVSLDLNEAGNRIDIGLDYGYAHGPMHKLVSRLGIPEGAVRIETSGPLVPLSTVRERARPYLGGLRTQSLVDEVTFGVSECTLGFNALTSDNRKVFVTASHCTMTPGDSDGTFIFQDTLDIDSVPANFIGEEIEDYGVPCGNLQCTHADAALNMPDDTTDWVLGRIARTSCECGGATCGDPPIAQCQVEINSTRPYFNITAVQASFVMGALVHKVGEATGTTDGYVTATCKTVRGNGLLRDCQVVADFAAGEGDSGGPVFLDWSTSQDTAITLGGVIVGSYQGKIAFSPWSGIEQNYPGLTVF